jgi:hypothetical protein
MYDSSLGVGAIWICDELLRWQFDYSGNQRSGVEVLSGE